MRPLAAWWGPPELTGHRSRGLIGPKPSHSPRSVAVRPGPQRLDGGTEGSHNEKAQQISTLGATSKLVEPAPPIRPFRCSGRSSGGLQQPEMT